MTDLRSILVPLDGSPFAEQALAVATAVGRPAKAKLRLALAHQVPPAPRTTSATRLYTQIELATRKGERQYLSDHAARLKDEGYPQVTSVVLCGPPGPTLADYVKQCDVSLVVMSTHGRGGLERAWLGSVADYLVRHVSVPVLLVRPGEPLSPSASEFGSILVPLDGSKLAEASLAPATRLAHLLGATVHLLQVVPPFAVDTTLPLSYPTGYDERLSTVRRTEAQDYLNDLADGLRDAGVRATSTALLGGSVPDTILAVARKEPVGMIVLATRGYGGVRRLVLGSVADKVVRTADRPVLVCPTRGRR